MDKFEYARLTRDREARISTWMLDYKDSKDVLESLTNEKLLTVLNVLGEEGWRVVSIEEAPTRVLLMRKVIS
ncbi:hypothetical protein [Paenibacillus chitinolyticus]|uniref:hypothetical protein n=1 Tax=Paenibacillus chitinolyticus TaxID=79263 RepID=UPI003671525A